MAATRTYTVRQGDCISSIAEQEGLFWQTLWDANPKLKRKRRDANALRPGDEVLIPERRRSEEPGSTAARHRFKKKGVPAKLRLIVEQDDVPIRNERYVLTVDGRNIDGQTDDSGFLEQVISPTARQARLEIAGLVYELQLGGMDPIEEMSGIQTRLQNLGFYHGEIDGAAGAGTVQAIADFQSFSGLDATGKLDEATREKLFGRQDRPHETGESDTASPEAQEAPHHGEDARRERAGDGEEVDEDEVFAEVELEIPGDVSDV